MRDSHLRLGKSESLEASTKPVQAAVGPTLRETYPHGAAAYLIDVTTACVRFKKKPGS
jgi:hypothetical protein